MAKFVKDYYVTDHHHVDIDDDGNETTFIRSHKWITRFQGDNDPLPWWWVRIQWKTDHEYAGRYHSLEKAIKARNKWLKDHKLPIPD